MTYKARPEKVMQLPLCMLDTNFGSPDCYMKGIALRLTNFEEAQVTRRGRVKRVLIDTTVDISADKNICHQTNERKHLQVILAPSP